MSTLAQWGGSLLVLVVYAYFVGTGIWLVFVVPGMYKRQRHMLKRLDALERRISELTPTQ